MLRSGRYYEKPASTMRRRSGATSAWWRISRPPTIPPEALSRLVEIYLKLGLTDQAQAHGQRARRITIRAAPGTRTAGIASWARARALDRWRTCRTARGFFTHARPEVRGWGKKASSPGKKAARNFCYRRLRARGRTHRAWNSVFLLLFFKKGTSSMLTLLSIRDVVLIEKLDLAFGPRPDRAHRRDRRRQIDPAGQPGPGAGRTLRCRLLVRSGRSARPASPRCFEIGHGHPRACAA